MLPLAINLEPRFPSQAIFLPNAADIGGVSNAGAAYLYQLEANGSATYLTKVTAPNGAAWRSFRILYLSIRQYSRRQGTYSRSGVHPMPERLIFTNWKPMDPLPT